MVALAATAAVLVPVALTVPRDTRRVRPSRSEARISAVASTGSRERPRAREKTLVEPPGITASIGRCGAGPFSSRPLTTSFTVPSPPTEIDDVDAVGGRLGAELPRVAAVGGLDDVELELAGQGTDQHVAHPGVVLVAAGLTTTSARMTARLTSGGRSTCRTASARPAHRPARVISPS